jgi:hypothetical protein
MFMKQNLLVYIVFIFTTLSYGQVVLNQVDDFEDGTEQNWEEAAASAALGFAATNVSSGGPNGADDNYLRDITSGSPGGAGSRMIIRSIGNQWSGNFTSAGVFAMSMDVRSLTNDITVRVSVTGPGGKFSTTNGVSVPAGGPWTEIGIPIAASDFTSVSDGSDGGVAGFDIAATLADVTEMRILSSPTPAWRGEVIDAEMHLDNITALAALSLDEFSQGITKFVISPNPGRNTLNLKVPQVQSNMVVTVYDVLGKKIYQNEINQLRSSVDVSQWRSGIYLVKVTDGQSTQTKRFIKQ